MKTEIELSRSLTCIESVKNVCCQQTMANVVLPDIALQLCGSAGIDKHSGFQSDVLLLADSSCVSRCCHDVTFLHV